MRACPFRTVELRNIFTVLAKAMIEYVQSQVLPFSLLVFNFIIILASKFLQSTELLFESDIGLLWRKICGLWRGRCWAAWRHFRLTLTTRPCHAVLAVLSSLRQGP